MGNAAKSHIVISSASLAKKDFDYFRKLIEDKAGITLSDGKHTMVGTRLSRRIRELGLAGYDEYRVYLAQNMGSELETFTNLLTTNKTHFFRENDHFEFIKNRFMPTYKTEKKSFYAWCGACSTGAEVYTLAMILEEAIQVSPHFSNYRILGTDIDTKVLEVAGKGVYDKSVVDTEVPEVYRKKFFLGGKGANDGKVRFNPKFTDLLKFRQYNLVNDPLLPMQFDLIMIRNVLIYFEPEVVYSVVEKAARTLHIGGYLIVGQCEPLRKLPEGLQQVETSVYRRVR